MDMADRREADALFGARTKEELPYFGPLMNLPIDFIDIHFAFSRRPGGENTNEQQRRRLTCPTSN